MHIKMCRIFCLAAGFIWAGTSMAEIKQDKVGIVLVPGDTSLSLGVWGQAGYNLDVSSLATKHSFEINHARIDFQGRIKKDWAYRLYSKFSNYQLHLSELWLRYDQWSFVKFTAGLIKIEFSPEISMDARWLKFIEHATGATDLGTDIQLGLRISGKIADDRFAYAATIYNDKDEANATNSAIFGALRLHAQPFKTNGWFIENLRLSIASSVGMVNRSLAEKTHRTQASTVYLQANDNLRQNGLLLRYDAALDWILGPVQVGAEVLGAYRLGLNNTNASMRQTAWFATATWLITGEDVPYEERVRPLRPLNDGGAGAWGVAARFEEMITNTPTITSGAVTGVPLVWSVVGGLRWYPIDEIRMMLDFTYTQFPGASRPANIPPSECRAAFNMQFSL